MTNQFDDLIVFDGTCVFCSHFARFMAAHDRDERFRFVTAQSDLGRALYEKYGLDPKDLSTSIVITNQQAHTKWLGVCHAMEATHWPFKAIGWLKVLPPRPVNWCYDRFSKIRYVFGRRACELPSQGFRGRLIE